MTQSSDIQLTISFTDPTLGSDEKDAEVARLLINLRELAEVRKVYLVAKSVHPQSEAPTRILNEFQVGTLTAEIPVESIGNILGFLHHHLQGKAITLTLNICNEMLTVQAQTPQDLQPALLACETFLTPFYDSAPQS
jgi:hypothetical protein